MGNSTHRDSIVFVFVLFRRAKDKTQGPAHAKQVLYHQGTSPAPLLSPLGTHWVFPFGLTMLFDLNWWYSFSFLFLGTTWKKLSIRCINVPIISWDEAKNDKIMGIPEFSLWLKGFIHSTVCLFTYFSAKV
jgi:hypothetical protein